MERNKIPIWGNETNYLDEVDFLVNCLLALADRNYQLRIWYKEEGPEIDSYNDSFFDLNDAVRYFKDLIREKSVNLTKNQILSVLKVSAMLNYFNRNIWKEKDMPKDWHEETFFIINHPYWIKLSKQAEYALSLLKIK